MNSLISICIPTYHRPDLLHQAVDSCLNQTYQDIEIIIGDDSTDDRSAQVADCFNRPDKIRYYQNYPSLGQADNINRLLDLAKGDRLVLLHDDDLLIPDAITQLDRCWQQFPELTAAYGKQQIISMFGEVLVNKSRRLNLTYHRTADKAGLQSSPLTAALLQQFPNDGYMVLTTVARTVRFRGKQEVGDACDFDFGLRLGAISHQFYFLNQYTARYRLTTISVSNEDSNDAVLTSFNLIRQLDLPDHLEDQRTEALRHISPRVVAKYFVQGEKESAITVLLSPYYPPLEHFSPRGVFYLLYIFLPTSVIEKLRSLIKQLIHIPKIKL